jgi:hypothetical protein
MCCVGAWIDVPELSELTSAWLAVAVPRAISAGAAVSITPAARRRVQLVAAGVVIRVLLMNKCSPLSGHAGSGFVVVPLQRGLVAKTRRDVGFSA